MMALHMERLACQPSPKGFEGVTSFLTTGFLSDIRLRIEEILTELEPWQIMYERLIEFRKKENDWPSVTEGSWACGAIRSAWLTNGEDSRRSVTNCWSLSALNGTCWIQTG